jgi:hypothetical protein
VTAQKNHVLVQLAASALFGSAWPQVHAVPKMIFCIQTHFLSDFVQ